VNNCSVSAGPSGTIILKANNGIALNTNNGYAAVLFEAAVNEQKNNPDAMKSKEE
jgi:hypothetical protein